jgi:hypothetical protein
VPPRHLHSNTGLHRLHAVRTTILRPRDRAEQVPAMPEQDRDQEARIRYKSASECAHSI